jgi:peptidoglycan/LPS O-acetylase OafA/YrhL
MTWNYLKGFGLLWVQGQLPGVFEGSFYPLAFNGPLWTIPIETTCYLVLLIGGILGFSRSGFSSLIFGFGTVFLSVVVGADIDHYKKFHLVHMDVVSFLKLAALFFLSASIYHYRLHIPRLTGVAGAMLVAIFFASGTRFFGLVFLLFFPYVILCLAFIPNKTISQFGKFGDYSYGMYLYAWPVQQAVMQFWGGRTKFFRICID